MQQQTAFVIERGIPLPERVRPGRKRGGLAERFRTMKKGDSLFVAETLRPPRSVKAQAHNKSYPGKRAVRVWAHKDFGPGVRVWRVK